MIGEKHDKGKLRISLLPIEPLWEVVKVLEHGAIEYGEDNWKNVPNAHIRYYNAAIRHILAWFQGDKIDGGEKGSGLNHLAHAICCLWFLLWFDIISGGK